MPEETTTKKPEKLSEIGTLYHISLEHIKRLKAHLKSKGYVFFKEPPKPITYISDGKLHDGLYNFDGCLTAAWGREEGTRGLFLSVINEDLGKLVRDFLGE